MDEPKLNIYKKISDEVCFLLPKKKRPIESDAFWFI
jgi:hypothetical protein